MAALLTSEDRSSLDTHPVVALDPTARRPLAIPQHTSAGHSSHSCDPDSCGWTPPRLPSDGEITLDRGAPYQRPTSRLLSTSVRSTVFIHPDRHLQPGCLLSSSGSSSEERRHVSSLDPSRRPSRSIASSASIQRVVRLGRSGPPSTADRSSKESNPSGSSDKTRWMPLVNVLTALHRPGVGFGWGFPPGSVDLLHASMAARALTTTLAFSPSGSISAASSSFSSQSDQS